MKKKTPKNLRDNARNWYRRHKSGLPEGAPLHSRAKPANKPRRGNGNLPRMVSMPPDAWERLDELRTDFNQTRGEYLADLFTP